jgi:hypothetical protein
MTLTWLAETEGKSDPFIVRRMGRGGVFPEFKPLGVVKSVKLKAIRSFTRGVPKEDKIEYNNTRTIHAYIRLKCPHCPGERRVRQGASYHKNRNTMIRQHLLDCEGWPWIVPPPQKRSKEKPMECRKTLTQPTLDGFAVRSMERDDVCKVCASETSTSDMSDSVVTDSSDANELSVCVCQLAVVDAAASSVAPPG